MKKFFKIVGIIIGIIFVLCACSSKVKPVGYAEDEEIVIESDEAIKEEIIAPSKEEVYSTRSAALEGMTEDEINALTEYIKTANIAFEHAEFYKNFFDLLTDSNHLSWNYFEETGRIQIGWAFDEGVEYDESLGITHSEFLDAYGDPVMAYNDYDGNDFIDTIKNMKDNLENDLLDADLDNLIENMTLAMETHDVEYMKKVYYILHDMDYFFLRYSPEDVAPYVSDVSTIAKYYGVLEVYK